MNERVSQKYVEEFKNGSYQHINLSKTSKKELSEIIVRKAFKDAISGERYKGRNESQILRNADKIKEILLKELTDKKDEIINNFDNWHNSICSKTDYGMRYGVWQKLVNMTFKHIYCVKDFYPEFSGVWDKCHCPLDSNTIASVFFLLRAERFSGTKNPNELKNKNINWNSISEEDYKDIQQKIGYICNKYGISKLEYDFVMWQ